MEMIVYTMLSPADKNALGQKKIVFAAITS